jgi:hypothetical protein
MPYIYIDKLFNELRAELLSAMHAAVEREVRNGKVDVNRLYRAFTRAAAGKCATPVRISDKCIAESSSVTRAFKPKERTSDD